MELLPNHIHVWSIDLAISPEETTKQMAILSPDERERAERFQQLIHRKRFIAARYALRTILGEYLNAIPPAVRFGYNQHGKPHLAGVQTTIHFNLAHSHDVALCAVTLDHMVGIDIEKIDERDHESIADRFFSSTEKLALKKLPPEEQATGFYRLWARKEALIKAEGKGLFIPLTSFSVSPHPITEMVKLENIHWTLMTLAAPAHFEAALASNQVIKKVVRQEF